MADKIYKSPLEQAQNIAKPKYKLKKEDEPFIEGFDEDKDVDFKLPSEALWPSDFDERYTDYEDPYEDQMSFYPTNKEDVFYVIGNVFGDGFVTKETVKKYLQDVWEYNKSQFDENEQ